MNEKKQMNLENQADEITENLIEEKRSKNNSKTRKKLIIFSIIFGVVIIGLAVILILNGQKTASIAKELELGEKYLEEGLYEEAKLAFDKVIEIDKKEVKGYEGKAKTNLVEKNYIEAEDLLNKSREIKTTATSDVLLSEVYMYTDRKEKALDLLENLNTKEGLEEYALAQAGNFLVGEKRYDEAEELIKKGLLETQDKESLNLLYQSLIKVNFLKMSDLKTIEKLVEEANLRIDNEKFKLEKISDLMNIEDYFKDLYGQSMAIVFYNFPENFSDTKDIQQEWVIYKYIIETMYKDGTDVREKNEEVFKKHPDFAKAYPNFSGANFVYLSDIEKIAKEQMNPEIRLEPNEKYTEIKQFKWFPEIKAFSVFGKGYPYVGSRLIIDEAYQVGEYVYIYGSEIIEGNYKSEYPSKGDEGELFCEKEKVGKSIMGASAKSEDNEYIFSTPERDLPKWLYVLKEKENQKYDLMSKQKISQ